MNNGKICVPVCSATVEDVIRQIKLARRLSDIVEVRLDCLAKIKPEDLENIFDNEESGPTLATLRSVEQGGHHQNTFQKRLELWQRLAGAGYVDLEEDIFAAVRTGAKTICSHHDFIGVPNDLNQIFDRLAAKGPDVVKIAAKVEDAAEAIPIWELVERAAAIGKPVIPIAMGEAGKWTRILGLAHGAFLTYASIGSGSETAPGQISAEDMRDVYRVKDLDPSTDVYGVIAGNTSYTMSPYMHNAAFKEKGINAVFVPFQVSDLGKFMDRMVLTSTREIDLNFKGFSVTNPHKLAVIKYLDEIDEGAKTIGAVNTVEIKNGKLKGYNTDASGFIEPLKTIYGNLAGARVAVVGAGGAARAVIYSLKQEKADVILFARDAGKAASLSEEFDVGHGHLRPDGRLEGKGFDIIVNSTPLGTSGEAEDETIAYSDNLAGVKLIYDLVYNPFETRLIKEGKKAGTRFIGGIEMIAAQATRQFKIWTGETAPATTMYETIKKKLLS